MAACCWLILRGLRLKYIEYISFRGAIRIAVFFMCKSFAYGIGIPRMGGVETWNEGVFGGGWVNAEAAGVYAAGAAAVECENRGDAVGENVGGRGGDDSIQDDARAAGRAGGAGGAHAGDH